MTASRQTLYAYPGAVCCRASRQLGGASDVAVPLAPFHLLERLFRLQPAGFGDLDGGLQFGMAL